MCDPDNRKNITCEKDKKKIENFISSLYFEMYTLSKEEDVNSNSAEQLKLNKGKEIKLKSKSNWLGTYKA
jgi:hypothetical protein